MHAIQHELTVFRQKIRGAHVGRQHAFFDHAMRIVALDRHNAFYLALRVKQDFSLSSLEINRAAFGARFHQFAEQRIEIFELRQQLALRGRAGGFVHQHRRDDGIGQPRVRAHHRFMKRVIGNNTLRINRHVAGHAQPINIRVDRTQPIRQMLRQHGNNLARKIHRVAALLRLGIQRVAGLDIVTHIRDRHDQSEFAATMGFAIHRVVEVARGFAVDGHQRQAAQIKTAFAVFRGDHRRVFRRQFFDLGREHVRQGMFTQCDLDFHAGVAVVAQQLHHARHRLTVPRGLRDQFHGHHLPGFGAADLIRRHHEFLADALVFRHHEVNAVTALQASHMVRFGTLQNLGDLAFRAAAAIHTGDARHHAIAMQHFAHFVGAEKHIRSLVITH